MKTVTKIFAIVLVLGLVFGFAPVSVASAEGEQNLFVSEWGAKTTLSDVSGRPTILFDGTLYHLWYGPSDTTLYHTSSTDPASFPTGTLTTYVGDIKPLEVSSPAIVFEGGTFYMVAYNTLSNQIFSLYTSPDGVVWTYKGDVFDGTDLTDWAKFDAPFLMVDGTSLKLYFQVKSSVPVDGTTYIPYYIYMAYSTLDLATIADGSSDNDFILANDGLPVLSPGESTDTDGGKVNHPTVIKENGVYYMWYTGFLFNAPSEGQLHFAYSTNGVDWTKGRSGRIIDFDPLVQSAEAQVIKVGDTWHLWYLSSPSIKHVSATGPFEFSSIQAAHDAATAGDTIIVADGTYTVATEPVAPVGLVNIYKQITIKAADDGNGVRPVIDATGRDGVFKIHANALVGGEVVIEGFDITGDKTTTGTAITAMFCGGDPATRIVINDNLIHGMIVGFNAWGSDAWCPAGTDYEVNVLEVTDNQFYDLGYTGTIPGYGVVLEGVSDWADSDNTYAAIVSGNTFDDIFTKGELPEELGIGVVFRGGSANAQITDNDFTGDISVAVGLQGTDVATTDISDNDLSEAVFGVVAFSTTGGPVDASPNWWGQATGPTAAQMMGSVDYIPWCTVEDCSEVGGPVHNVTQDTWFAAIQPAINAAIDGDEIRVSAGTFVEQLNINKRVSIIGAGKDGANPTIVQSTSSPTILLGATGTIGDPIILKDLQIQGRGGIRTTITPIDYFTIDNVWLKASTLYSGEGFRLVTGHQMTHLTIANSIIEGFIDGIIIEKTPGTGDAGTKLDYVSITDTTFTNNRRKGIYVETLSNAVFTNVSLINNGFVQPETTLADAHSAGIDINLKDGAYSNLQFINMTATGNGLGTSQGAALMIKARDDGTTYGANPATLTNVTITGGTFTGNERGIRIGEPNKTNAGPTNVVIHGASLLGNVKTYVGTDLSAYGDVVNYSLAMVDATGNWWGSDAGPAAGQTYGDVASCGWLLAPDGVAVAKPVVNTTRGTGFCTIQAAIDDAATLDGDVITVAAGTYDDGFIYIYKAVDLRGPNYGIAGPAARNPEAVIVGPGDDWLTVYVNVDGVSIDGFKFDGQYLDPGEYYTVGIYGDLSDDLTVQNNVFTDYEGMAVITSGGYSSYISGVTIKDNLITNTALSDSAYNFGLYLQSTLGSVTGNVVTNVRSGIQIQPYSAPGAGLVQDNEFSVYGTGMYFNYTQDPTANWTFSNNTVTGIPIPVGSTVSGFNGIRVQTFYAGNVTFTDNTINIGAANAPVIYPFRKINHTGGTIDLEATLDNNTWEKVVVVRDSLGVIRETTLVDPKLNGDATFFSTIQSAIDDVYTVAGDTVDVGPGTYTEQVIVNKSLSLVGTGAPVITPPTSAVAYIYPETGKWWEPVVFAYGGTADVSNVITGSDTITFNMSGFIVDGADRVPGSGHRTAGILLRNVDGVISYNTVENMLIDGFETFGIIAQGDSEITIDHNTVSGYARGGIAANGDASSTYIDPVATITNNIVSGPGMGIAVTWAPNGIQIGWGATGTITGNTVTGNGWPGSEWSGTGILVFASDNVTVSQNSVSNNETGIAVGGDLWYGTGPADDNVITENTVSGNTYGVSVQSAAADTLITENTITGSTYDGIDVFGTPAPTGTIIELNNVYGNNTANDPTSGDLWVQSGVATVDASPNWWGSLFGSEGIIGDATINQWCSVAWDAATDSGCYPLVPDVNGVIEIGPGLIEETIVINQPNLTIRALNGTSIEPTSGACFEINADFTTIEAATNLGAVCVPPAGENGINVADGLEEVVIKGLEFDGSAGGVDGIHFNGIANLMIIDNWFHDLTGDAIEFTAQPGGVVSIQGNLFQENTGLGINASTFTVPAEYNSWGHVNGAAAGDGASAGVVTAPYTHVDLYVGASGVAQVGETITLTVYGNLENVFGATFDFVYPDSLELVGTPTNHSAFVGPLGTSVFTVDALTRTITFEGYMGDSNPPVSGVDTPLFSATFDVVATGGLLDLVDTNDEFIMLPDTDPAPSTNIYAFELVDGELINTAYTVIGKVSMQGRSVTSGVPVALTGTGVYGPYGVSSIQAIGNNYTFTNVAAGEYVFTTNQPRYLNVAEGE